MARLFGLREEQVARIRPFFGQEQGGKRADDREVLSGILHGTRRGLCRVDGPAADGPHKTPSTTVSAAGQARVSLI